ncbi:hypothetical protein [Pontibacter amylolyticus]|uniref:Uncharacterized protein n=1 Tax=Pontibacter amylolyticus TaxID=1424080 RepID=A0ABQ1VYN0_9BACT|nr:hypothetical protein [Pontibacter amylolyticus]GGG02942.1 hypothetical protein GCM10011323_04720 [Pontibacter amylolyticus]
MSAIRKCPNCGQWSRWTQNPTDRCEHCNSILDPVAVARQQARAERKQEEEERYSIKFIEVNPDDPWYIQFFKRIGLGFQIAFVSIISFFIWLIALLAG